jgi:hypothetical protein
MAAIQAIRSISNWLGNGPTSESQKKLIYVSRKSTEPNIDKLRDAVAARKKAKHSTSPTRRIPSNYIHNEEYWIPLTLDLPDSTQDKSNSAPYNSKPSPTKEGKDREYRVQDKRKKKKKPMIWEVPIITAVIASVIVRLQVGEGAIGGVKEHIGGSLALDIVNSSWSPVILAGITWFLIGMAITEVLVEAIQSRQ